MKKVLFILLLVVLVTMIRSAETIADFEHEVKQMLNRVAPSMLKVVAENGKRYVATGIAIDGNWVVTTTQLLQQPVHRILVETARGESYPARVAGQDRLTGIALLRLERRVLTPIAVAGTSATGDWVALVGAFYDRFPAIVQGLVSSVGGDGLVINAPVAPGLLGGAVVNRNGQLIGVIRGTFGVALSPDYNYTDHSAEITIRGRREREEDLCLAVPAQMVLSVVADLKKYGRVRRAWLGVGFPSQTSTCIDEISRGSPAAQAGLREGDVIVAVNGQKLQEITSLWHMVENAAPDQELRLDIVRDRQLRQVKVRLSEKPDEQPLSAAAPFRPRDMGPGFPGGPGPLPEIENFVFEFSGSRQLGVETVELTPELALKFEVTEGSGLLISRVSEGGVARKAGLQAGDVIVRVRGNPVARVVDLHQRLVGLRDGEAIVLDLYRDGQLRKFSVVPDAAAKMGSVPRWEGMDDRMRAVSEFMKKAWLERTRKESALPKKNDDELRRQQERELKRVQTGLQNLEMERSNLHEDQRRQVGEEIRRLREDLRRIQEMMQKMTEDGAAPG